MSIKETAVKLTAKAGTKLKEASPDIFFYGGCVLLLGAAVYACHQTLKLEQVIDDANDMHESIDHTDYLDEKNRKKDHVKANIKMGVEIAKLYAPAVGIAAVGYFAVGKAHFSLKRDKKELLATVSMLENTYERYRRRVADKIGKEAENDIYRGYETEEREVEAEDGKKEKKNFRSQVYDPNDVTAFCFSKETCPSVFKGDPILDRNTLVNSVVWMQQQYNNMDFIHMIDIYHMFGFYPEPGEYQCRIGAEYGYVKGHGSDIIDIGLNDPSNLGMQAFLRGDTDAVWIHFNDCGRINKYL